MSDQAGADAPSTALATQAPAPPPRVIRVVESAVGIMDTARFEHMGRVATIMAQAGLLPESLTTYKVIKPDGTAGLEYHDFDTVRARAFMIVNQADLWKADPNAIAQATSLVHGKLMYEGKLVHGLIESRLGIRLRYDFGTYNHANRSVDLSAMPAGEDKSLGVIVTGRFDDEDFDRTIVGSVGMWETGAKGPWQKSTAWLRQLRYMGAREWCRAHAPSLILGIMTDDEIDHGEQQIIERRERKPREKQDIKARLAGPAPENAAEGQEGFNRAHVAAETGEAAAGAAEGGGDAIPPHGEPEPDAEEEKPAADADAGADDAKVDTPAPDAEEEPAAEEEEPAADASLSTDNIHSGPAPAGVTYLLNSEEPATDGLINLYKDGELFSRINAESGIRKHPFYDTHPEAGPANDAPAEDLTQHPGASDRQDDEDAGVDPPQQTIFEELAAMESWLQMKTRIVALNRDEDFQALDPKEQAQIRAKIWSVVLDVKKRTRDPVDQALDATAFRLWIETQKGKDGAEAIAGTWRVLKREAAFTKLPDAIQETLRTVTEARIVAEGGKI